MGHLSIHVPNMAEIPSATWLWAGEARAEGRWPGLADQNLGLTGLRPKSVPLFGPECPPQASESEGTLALGHSWEPGWWGSGDSPP